MKIIKEVEIKNNLDQSNYISVEKIMPYLNKIPVLFIDLSYPDLLIIEVNNFVFEKINDFINTGNPEHLSELKY